MRGVCLIGVTRALTTVTAAAFLALVVAFGSALSAVYSAALYAYAVQGEPPAGFDKYAMQDAFERKELAV